MRLDRVIRLTNKGKIHSKVEADTVRIDMARARKYQQVIFKRMESQDEKLPAAKFMKIQNNDSQSYPCFKTKKRTTKFKNCRKTTSKYKPNILLRSGNLVRLFTLKIWSKFRRRLNKIDRHLEYKLQQNEQLIPELVPPSGN